MYIILIDVITVSKNTKRGHINYFSSLIYNRHCILYLRLLKYIYVTSTGIHTYRNKILRKLCKSYLNNYVHNPY